MLDAPLQRVKRLLAGSAPMLVGLAIAVVIGTIVVGAVAEDVEYERTVERVEAYCYQTTGSPEVYVAMVVGNHGGFHCAAPHDGAHIHDVTEEALVAAYVANASGERVDWSTFPGERVEPWYERGFWPDAMLVVEVLLVLVVVGAMLTRLPRGM